VLVRDDTQLKIQRAEKHIQELHAVVKSFTAAHPIGVTGRIDPQTGEPVYYVAQTWVVPDEVPLIAGDVLQNLRSALDYLICALVRINGKEPSRFAAFPIADQEPALQKDKQWFESKIEDIHEDAKAVIRSLKPYRGGDDTLWRLHRLNITDKHRLLFTVGVALFHFDVGQHVQATRGTDTEGDELDFNFSPGWTRSHFPLKTGDVLFRDAPGNATEQGNKIHFSDSVQRTWRRR
jgi:hypothetical protein